MIIWRSTLLNVRLCLTALFLSGLFIAQVLAADDGRLEILGSDYPRAFFFRASESVAAKAGVTYESWRDEFSRLSGIIGKTLDEEVPGRSKNIDFFTRFKKDNPEQVVLLHLNGNSRDPRWGSERFFAGHWIYHNGAMVTGDVPAEDGETAIPVSDARLFKINMGRYRDKNEDIGLCMLGTDGKPDWSRSEQVQLLSIDVKGKTIKVRRGCYNTRPAAFPAGKAYAAAHATEGPWGKKSNLLWLYNYATCCPKDGNGRSCSDIWVEHLGELFGTGGCLAAYDGLEFDVLFNQTEAYRSGQPRGVDCDADGKPDGGIINGVNLYGSGVIEFCRGLRARLGDKRIIQADGVTSINSSQRAFHLLNGIESEGFPWLGDKAIEHWSTGLNRHMFWAENGRPPVFNYINHKFVEPTGIPGEPNHHPDVPMGHHRLVFAAGVFTDSAICYSYAPPGPRRGPMGIWDELVGGRQGRAGWLGRALGPAIHLAERQTDLLQGLGRPAGTGLLKRLSSAEARLELDGNSIKMLAVDSRAAQFKVFLRNVSCSGSVLYVSVRAKAEIPKKYPPEMARLMYVGVVDPGRKTEPAAGKNAINLPNGYATYINDKPFTAGFQFKGISSGNVDLELTCEMAEPVWLEEITVYAFQDAMFREFEHGMVLANPSLDPFTFNLAGLAPGKSFCRLEGSAEQDPETNDGSAAGMMVTLPPRDALFLKRR